MKRLTRRVTYTTVALALVAGLNLAVFSTRSQTARAAADAAASSPEPIVSGPGLVEPVSEEVRVSAQLGGKLQQVAVDEGDPVRAGQVLAVLENDEYRARVASAEAELHLKEAERRKVINGARDQERAEAAASLHEAEAVLDATKADHERRRGLFGDNVISREEMDRADQQLRVAEARVEALGQHHALVDAAAREEDAARAASDAALARARLDEARALYDKTFIRSPIAGIVLRRHRKAGESVSTQFDSPIVTLADRSVVRVRVDVDETDIARIAVGQPAYVIADAFGKRRFAGRVIRVGQVLGKKTVRTNEPSERVDQKILETLVELEDGRDLPIGLRVQAFIAPGH
jgi:HlyD family secretion protein